MEAAKALDWFWTSEGGIQADLPLISKSPFPESGRAKAGDGDLLEQVRAAYDG